jgi:type VI secretion system secreted protein VgrG
MRSSNRAEPPIMVATLPAVRPLTVTTVLDGKAPAPPKFALRRFQSSEAISVLFRASADVAVDKRLEFTFDQLLGTPMLVRIAASQGQGTRFFHAVCRRITQTGGDATRDFYRFDLVPHAWLLTKRTQSRIFQQTAVDDILKKVLAPLTPTPAYELGKYEPRDYCVQYHESDWNFAARLMEEEGIYFFFRHTDAGHQLVLADKPDSHKDVPFAPAILFKTARQVNRDEDVVTEFAKAQEIVTGKVTLWDHNFELPHKHLEADRPVQESVQVGQTTHKLKFGENGKLEFYEWPGEYAERFDGIAPGGVERPADLQKIFEDNKRTAGIRMQQEAAGAVDIQGASTCRQLTPGFKFALSTLSSDAVGRGFKADGTYVVTAVSQNATMPDDERSGDAGAFHYANSFSAMPPGLPFRPPRLTPRPRVPGSQTAVVCGPKGEEIFTDKYGRVKVQFHWDREGKHDANSSCWVRVATFWAGRKWGAVHVPRIGQEVVVDFLEGDPDRPIIVGSVYNADQMPPYKLPENKTRSGVKSNSTPGGQGFNEIRFEDKKGHEQIFIHAQGNHDLRVNGSSMTSVGGSAHLTVGGTDKNGQPAGDLMERVFNDHNQHVGNNQVVWVEGDRNDTVTGDVVEEVQVGGRYSAATNGNMVQQGKAIFVKSNTDLVLQGANIYMNATSMIQLNVGGNLVTVDATGVTVFGTLTKVNCPGSVARPVPVLPTVPMGSGVILGANTAKPEDPDPADNAASGQKSSPD